MNEKKNQKWLIGTLAAAAVLLTLFALPTILLDPCFHYHGPLEGLSYKLNDERYQNDGIVRHFDYDALITGSSMTENFKTSELDALFGTKSIKVPFSGSGYKEQADNLRRAFAANPDLNFVLWGFDMYALLEHKDWTNDYEGPQYLYDNKLFNDVEYVLNKEILLFKTYADVIVPTLHGKETTSFDDYVNWMGDFRFGADAIRENWRRAPVKPSLTFGEEHRQKVQQTLEQNLLSVIRDNPQTTFYLFYPPYSICYWDTERSNGTLEVRLEAMAYAASLLLELENVRLFEYCGKFDLVCDLTQYKDYTHYNEDINSQILHWIHRGENRLTRENYVQRFGQLREFYVNFDYDAFFHEQGFAS